MKKILTLFATLIFLSGCVHKMDIQQGNILDQDSVSKLHKGMSQEEVRNLLGTPVLINTFRDNRVDYVYTNKPGRGKGVEKNIILEFKGGTLKQIAPLTEQPFGK